LNLQLSWPGRKDVTKRNKDPVEVTDLLIKLLFPREEYTKETAVPMPKTPRLPFT